MTVDSSSSVCNLEILDSLSDDSIEEILESWSGFCLTTEALLRGNGDLSFGSEFVSHAHTLCNHGLESLVEEHFLRSLEVFIRKVHNRFITVYQFKYLNLIWGVH